MAELLINYGADINQKGLFEKTPLHWAISDNNTEMSEYFISRGADLNGYARYELETPLYFAKKVGNQEIIDLIIEGQNSKFCETGIIGYKSIFDAQDVCCIL